MIRVLALFAAALALTLAGPAGAQKIDKNGRCHDASGKFAKMEVCRGVTAGRQAVPAPGDVSARPAAAGPPGVLRCRDKTTKKFVKCGAPNTEPVPAGK